MDDKFKPKPPVLKPSIPESPVRQLDIIKIINLYCNDKNHNLPPIIRDLLIKKITGLKGEGKSDEKILIFLVDVVQLVTDQLSQGGNLEPEDLREIDEKIDAIIKAGEIPEDPTPKSN